VCHQSGADDVHQPSADGSAIDPGRQRNATMAGVALVAVAISVSQSETSRSSTSFDCFN
jgi:hypothetical protein